VLVIPALSFIALLNDARKCLVSVVQDSLLSAVNEGEKKFRNLVNSALSVGQSEFLSPYLKVKIENI
jgi:hypothetical protein